MEIGINQIKSGQFIELDGEIFSVVDYDHVKPGKGSAFVRTKLKNMRLGTIIDRTFRSNERLKLAHIEKRTLQYLYEAGEDSYEFMDTQNYEQFPLRREQLGEVANYLKENLEVTGLFYRHHILVLEVPIFVELRVAHTEPGIRGDTSRSGTKPARLESGMEISVPLFINTGDVIRIDTRKKTYVGRA